MGGEGGASLCWNSFVSALRSQSCKKIKKKQRIHLTG